MNKIIIFIIALFFFFPAYIFPQSINKTQEQISKDSPFGMSGAILRPFVESDKVNPADTLKELSESKEPYKHALDLGVKWVRPGADIYWPMVQPNPEYIINNIFDWRAADIFYSRVPPGVNTLATIDALAWGVNIHPAFKTGTWEFTDEKAEKYYIKFVKEVVERYDGDGYKDMPELKNPIKYWQIGNEPALRPILVGDKELAKELFNKNPDWNGYSHLVEITYKAIKESDAEAKIALAGMAGGYPFDKTEDIFMQRFAEKEWDFYARILENLKGKYIDIFDIHYYGSPNGGIKGWQWDKIKNAYNVFRRLLDENGYKNTEIWITETAVPSNPFGERFQAINLVKRYIYPLSFGVKKVFWWNMIEGEGPDLENENKPSNHYGPVYDGIGKDDPGYGVKKLSYYTYKKMVEVLEGSDWDNIQTIQESNSTVRLPSRRDEGKSSQRPRADRRKLSRWPTALERPRSGPPTELKSHSRANGVYIYKFIKNGKNIWVAWNDNANPQTIALNVGNVNSVKITEAVPKYESGKDITDYDTAFNIEIKPVKDGKVTINLKEVPVFIETLSGRDTYD